MKIADEKYEKTQFMLDQDDIGDADDLLQGLVWNEAYILTSACVNTYLHKGLKFSRWSFC